MFTAAQNETALPMFVQARVDEGSTFNGSIQSSCGHMVLSPGMAKLTAPIALNVTTKQGVQFTARMAVASHCAETELTLTPTSKRIRIPVHPRGIEASIGVWVFVHTFTEPIFNVPCDPLSYAGQAGCAVQSTLLPLMYHPIRKAYTATFIADWPVKYYKVSLEVMVLGCWCSVSVMTL